MCSVWSFMIVNVLPLLGTNEPLNYNPRLNSKSEFLSSAGITSTCQYISDKSLVLNNFFLFYRTRRMFFGRDFKSNYLDRPIPAFIALEVFPNKMIRQASTVNIGREEKDPSSIIRRRFERFGIIDSMEYADPVVVLKNPFTDTRQKWLRYKLERLVFLQTSPRRS
uniref:Uncharacterized protein n=1 Tax=Lepeophtheirus salmonis TaxID=72036 RepID=A0A0K2UPL7_LEPSM